MNAILEQIGARFPLTALDPGAYAAFKAGPLSIQLDWYRAEGLGNVSFLHGKAMGGLMQMDTLVVNALMRDVPLFSYDYIAAMGNHTMLVEYYDTLLHREAFDTAPLLAVKTSIAPLTDNPLGEHWYDDIKLAPSFSKKVKKKDLPGLNGAFTAALDAYLTLAEKAPLLPEEAQAEKREKSAAYVNGLLEKGGPSTDAFVKALGPDKTRNLFTRIVFGSEG